MAVRDRRAQRGYLMADYIKATDLYTLTECDRRIYLNYFGNPDERVPRAPFEEWLAQEGERFEQTVIEQFTEVYQPRYRIGDLEAGYDATLELMAEGVPIIYQGVIIHDIMIGIPDLLERVEGGSRLGGYYYRPIDIKLATRAKLGHRLQVMAYIALLEGLQGIRPDGSLFLRLPPEERSETALYQEEKVALDEQIFADKLAEIRELAAGLQPRPFISSVCKSCPWHDSCLDLADQERDVSLIPGLPRKVWAELHARGMGTLPAAASATRAQLINISGVGDKRAFDIIHRSRSLDANTMIQVATPDLPEPGPVETFFDVESIPTEGIIYLFGALIGANRRYEFAVDLAPTFADEHRAWQDFLRRMDRTPGYVYHYGTYERTAIKQLMARYGDDPRAHGLLDRMIDLEKVLKAAVVLPLRGYSLKDVAPWLGFEWQGTTDNAADSMVEYITYQTDGDRDRLDGVMRYNEDDCYATVHIRDWLLTLPHIK
ncbi:MAG: TM0106 family RecB-like putative nuclease [Anaerolineae bacterium]